MPRTRYHAGSGTVTFKALPAAALRAVFREGYALRDLRSDILAGVVVGIVALPLAMALAIAVGVPPQQGLYTAIVAGAVVAALGGSRTLVTGPTAAFIVVLAPIYAKFGMAGLLVSGLMGGVLLLTMGIARLGQFIEFIPHPVTTGFTAGIATVIAALQIKDVLGLKLERNPDQFFDRLVAMFEARGTASLAELCIAAVTLALLLFLPRVIKRIPAPLLALPISALLGIAISRLFPGHPVATIATRFHATIGGKLFDGIPPLPPLPMLPWTAPGPGGLPLILNLAMIRELLTGAFAVAMLGGIESLLSAVISDGMAGTRHDPDAELVALGIGNIVAPFFGGIPATGAIARTATNVRSGARSPIAAIVHSATVLAAVIVLAPLIGHLPMAALAALLLLVAKNMAELKHFRHIVRVAPGSDVLVLLTCYGLTVIFDMVIAVSVGVVLAALLFMRRMADITKVSLTQEGDGEHAAALARIPKDLVKKVAIYDIAGPLFFGAAQKAMGSLAVAAGDIKVLIIRLDAVPVMDATGLVALESAIETLSKNNCVAILSGLQAQPARLVERAGFPHRPWRLMIRPDFAGALTAAEGILGLAPSQTTAMTEVDIRPPGSS